MNSIQYLPVSSDMSFHTFVYHTDKTAAHYNEKRPYTTGVMPNLPRHLIDTGIHPLNYLNVTELLRREETSFGTLSLYTMKVSGANYDLLVEMIAPHKTIYVWCLKDNFVNPEAQRSLLEMLIADDFS